MIKNLVLSAGAVGGLYIYGALKASHQAGLWKHENIRTLWGTSFGSILSVVISLNCEWEVLDDYLIKRPWQTVFKLNWMNLWQEKGLLCKQSIKDALSPLFHASEIPLNITLADFFAKTGKELHLFVTELDIDDSMFRSVDVNPITHPEWLVLDAVYASCCLPLVFNPFEIVSFSNSSCGIGYEDNCDKDMSGNSVAVSKTFVYLDGAILCAFPFYECLKHSMVREEEVFGIYLNKSENVKSGGGSDAVGGGGKLLKNMNLFDFMKVFCSAVFNYTDHSGRDPPKSEKALLVKLVVDMYERFDLSVIRTEEKRVEYISRGAEMFSRFWDEKSRQMVDDLTEDLSESGHEIICDGCVEEDEVSGDLDANNNASDL
jgi:predicted acylesterase/phospholipase RssA